MAVLRIYNRLAAFSAECALHLYRSHSPDVAVLRAFLGGPRSNSFLCADGIGVVVSIALFDAVHRSANVRLVDELVVHRGRGRFEWIRHLFGALSAVQQLGCAVSAGETLPR